MALPKKSSATPPDVRKAFGLPASPPLEFWAVPSLLGRSPDFITNRNGSAERFRTSGGIAESREHFLGKAERHAQGDSVWRETNITLLKELTEFDSRVGL